MRRRERPASPDPARLRRRVGRLRRAAEENTRLARPLEAHVTELEELVRPRAEAALRRQEG